MNKSYLQAELKQEDGKLVFIASDETLDRHGEVIPLDSWDLKNYKKNPVLLVNHDYQVQNIVGRAKNVGVRKLKGSEKQALTFEPEFHEITELARTVREMVEGGVLNTVSVGFIRHYPDKDGGRERNELMEISFVPVPANPGAEALSVLMAKSVEATEEAKIKEFIGEAEPIADEVKEGRVLSKKNRELISNAVETAKSAITALEDVLQATEPTENAGEATEIKNEPGDKEETPVAPKGKAVKGRAKARNSLEARVLRHIAKQINRALYQIKQNE